MSRILKPNFESTDERGVFREVVSGGTWKAMNYSSRKAGSVLGSHYHKKMDELIYVISGRMKVKLVNLKNHETEEFEVKQNDLFVIKPYELHVISVVEDSAFVALLSHEFDKNSPDLFKME